MAKKVAPPEEKDEEGEIKKPKKKRSKCCTCCLAFLIVIIIIFAAAFGVGWYFGDKFTKQYLDMSLGDVFGVTNGLYWTDDKDVVKNPYTQADLDGFYNEIKKNILLKESAEIDFDAALKTALDDYMKSDNANAQKRNAVYPSADGDGAGENSGDGTGDNNGESGADESSIMDVFVDMIAGVLTRDNIDVERLNAYDENDPKSDTYIFNLKDKQLAAFISSVLNMVLEDAGSVNAFKQFAGVIDFKRVVSLKQVRFLAENQTVDGAETVKATTADITVWVGLQSAANQAIKYYLKEAGVGWAGGFVGWLGNVILPENLYATVTIPLYGDAEPQLTLNDMDASERDRAYKLVDGILKMNGTSEADDKPQTVRTLMNDFADKLKPYLEAASEKMPLNAVNDGTIKVDLLSAVAQMANEDTEGEPLTKADFLYVLQALFSDPAEQLHKIEPYRYDNYYLVDGKEVYMPSGGIAENKVDYEQMFIEEIENKYSINLGESASLDDVLNMLGVSLGGEGDGGSAESVAIADLINAQKFNASLDKSVDELKIRMTDRMLGAVLSSQMDKILGGTEGMDGLKLDLRALTFIEKAEKPGYLYALLSIEADVAGMLENMGGDNALITKIATGLMPESILLTVTVDITQDLPAGYKKDEAEFVLNSCKNTDRALATLEKLVPDLNLNDITGQVDEQLNGMLKQMQESIKLQLVPSTMTQDEATLDWSGTNGAIVLPDIFTMVTDMALTDDDGKRIIQPEELKDVLKGINDTDGFDAAPIEGDYSGFIADVTDKYYLDTKGEALTDFDALTAFMSDFDTSKFRISGDEASVKYLAHDTRTVEQLRPVMTGEQLGALIKDKIAGNEAFGGYNINEVTTGEDELGMVLSIPVKELLPDDVSFMLATDNIFVTVTVDMGARLGIGTEADPFRYGVEFNVNKMDSTAFDNMFKLVKHFSPDFDIQTQVDEIGKTLYEQMHTLNESIAGGMHDMSSPMFRFTDAGLQMIDFYTFLSNKMELELDGTTTADVVKATVQGLYERKTGALENDNNYVLRDNIIYNRREDVTWNDASNTSPDYTSSDTYKLANGGVSDIKFNARIKGDIEDFDSAKNLKVEQTIIVAAKQTGVENARAETVRAWANGKLGNKLSENGDYMLITVSLGVEQFMETSDAKSLSFFPERMYVTMVYRKAVNDGVTEFESVGVILNDMNETEYDVLTRLMKLSAPESGADDEKKVNVNTITKKCAEVVNAVTTSGYGQHATIIFGKNTDSVTGGIGSIRVSANI